MTDPLVSFIVTSFNYAHYIGKTISSVLDQTVKNFELIIIDDNSTDGSFDVVRSFSDSRIKFLRNTVNLGGSRSFNRAFEMTRGRYIANLDSDDWIEPAKTEEQLRFLQRHPDIGIIGTWVNVVSSSGERHPEADAAEKASNDNWNFNEPASWCVRNALCRSSTLLDRSVHDTCGLYDTEMIAAPDYELWTRALSRGFRYALLQDKLTNYRLHARGVTHANPLRSLLEISYLLVKNLYPVIESTGWLSLMCDVFDWVFSHPSFYDLTARERYRLAALVGRNRNLRSYEEFERAVYDDADMDLTDAGKFLVAQHRLSASVTSAREMRHNWEEVRNYLEEVIKARDYWAAQANSGLVRQVLRRFRQTKK